MLFQVAGAHIFIYMQLTLGASTSLYEISRLCCRHMDNVLNQNLGLMLFILIGDDMLYHRGMMGK